MFFPALEVVHILLNLCTQTQQIFRLFAGTKHFLLSAKCANAIIYLYVLFDNAFLAKPKSTLTKFFLTRRQT